MAPTWPRPAGASNTGRSASAAGRNAGTSRLDAAHRSTALHDLGPAWLLQARSRLPWRGSSRNAGGVLVARNSSSRIGVRQMREHEDPQPQAAQLAMCRTGRSRSSLPERLRPARQGCEPHRRPTTDCVRACAQHRRTRPFPWLLLGSAGSGRHWVVETTPGSSNPRPSKKRPSPGGCGWRSSSTTLVGTTASGPPGLCRGTERGRGDGIREQGATALTGTPPCVK
jgi:hypothetical protein